MATATPQPQRTNEPLDYTPTTPRSVTPAPGRPEERNKKVLNQALERFQAVEAGLEQRIAKIEEILPSQMKGQGRRLARRALMTLARKPELAKCPTADFVRCVIEAAELGMAIDGKLGYVVPYKSTWQFQADYKGLIAAARQRGIIKDCYARLVCANDEFSYGEQDGREWLGWKPAVHERGSVIGAFAKVILPDGTARYEYMDLAELKRIKERAPSKNGPWATDEAEMQKKTVIRRAMKMYCDEPVWVPETGEDNPSAKVVNGYGEIVANEAPEREPGVEPDEAEGPGF